MKKHLLRYHETGYIYLITVILKRSR